MRKTLIFTLFFFLFLFFFTKETKAEVSCSIDIYGTTDYFFNAGLTNENIRIDSSITLSNPYGNIKKIYFYDGTSWREEGFKSFFPGPRFTVLLEAYKKYNIAQDYAISFAIIYDDDNKKYICPKKNLSIFDSKRIVTFGDSDYITLTFPTKTNQTLNISGDKKYIGAVKADGYRLQISYINFGYLPSGGWQWQIVNPNNIPTFSFPNRESVSSLASCGNSWGEGFCSPYFYFPFTYLNMTFPSQITLELRAPSSFTPSPTEYPFPNASYSPIKFVVYSRNSQKTLKELPPLVLDNNFPKKFKIKKPPILPTLYPSPYFYRKGH